jgi:hypothetical protein
LSKNRRSTNDPGQPFRFWKSFTLRAVIDSYRVQEDIWGTFAAFGLCAGFILGHTAAAKLARVDAVLACKFAPEHYNFSHSELEKLADHSRAVRVRAVQRREEIIQPCTWRIQHAGKAGPVRFCVFRPYAE